MCSSVSSAGQTARKTCSTLQCPKQQDKTEALNLASPPLLCRFRQRKHKRQLRSTYTFHDKSPLCARRLAFKPLLVVLSPRHELTSFSEVDSWHVRQHVRNEDKGEPMLLLYGTTIEMFQITLWFPCKVPALEKVFFFLSFFFFWRGGAKLSCSVRVKRASVKLTHAHTRSASAFNIFTFTKVHRWLFLAGIVLKSSHTHTHTICSDRWFRLLRRCSHISVFNTSCKVCLGLRMLTFYGHGGENNVSENETEVKLKIISYT